MAEARPPPLCSYYHSLRKGRYTESAAGLGLGELRRQPEHHQQAAIGITDLGESDTLHTAAERGRADLVRLLLGRGTDIDALGFEYCAVESRADEAGSALQFAVDGGSVEIEEIFLEHGADAGFKDVKEKGMERIVQILHNFASES